MEATKLPVAAVDASHLTLPSQQPSDASMSFETALASGRLDEALRQLNARTRHRYTSIVRFDPPFHYCFDREIGFGIPLPSRALDDSYSGIVRRTARPFFTEASENDARLMSHPARTSMRSYMGVPIHDVDGTVRGVLYHHDDRPRAAPAAELDLLLLAGPVAARWLVASGGLAPR